MNLRLTLLAATALFVIGCSQETERQPEFFGDLGSPPDPDVTDASDAADHSDTRDSHARPDTRDATDTGADGGDIEIPPREELFVPEPPLENTLCRDGWCWLHPRPFPHDVVELKSFGDEIYGAAELSYDQSAIPFIWSDSGLSFPTRPDEVPPDFPNVFGSVDIGAEGWIQLASGHLIEYGPDGLRKAIDLPSETNSSLSANSADNFIAYGGLDPLRARDGAVVKWESSPLPYGAVELWPNGEIWQIGVDLGPPPEPDYITVFPDLDTSNAVISHLGPGPQSACASEGIWGAGLYRDVYRWDAGQHSWQRTKLDALGRFTDLFCHNEQVTIVDSGGAIYRRTDDGWEHQTIADARLTTGATRGNTLYLGGPRGELVALKNGDVQSPSAGFRIPAGDLDGGSDRHFMGLWVSQDERNAALMTRKGLYRTSGDGWVRKTTQLPEGLGEHDKVEFYGEDDPQMLVADGSLYEWSGTEFKADVLPSPDDEPRPTIVDVQPAGGGVYWAATRTNLYRFDGRGWSLVTKHGHPVDDFLEEENLSIETIYPGEHGDLLIAIGENLYRLAEGDTEWPLTREGGLPCEDVRSIHRDENGDLYIQSPSGCAARFDETWSPLEANGNLGSVSGFVEDPDSPRPAVVSDRGIFRFDEEGTLRRTSAREVEDVKYLPFSDAMISVNFDGVLVNYDSNP